MKKSALLTAAVVTASLFAVNISAAEHNEKVLKHTPVIDGKIDAAYMQSYHIDHEWKEDTCWALGKFEPNEEGVTSYGWDTQATSYFLWDDECIYIAVKVNDDDFGVIDDAHYAKATADRTQPAPNFQDGIAPRLTYKGMTFTITADAAGRLLCVYKEPNFTDTVWCDLHSWSEYEKNISDGFFATVRTDYGYNIEIKMPLSENVKSKLLKDGGKFAYGLQVCDATANSKYADDYALSLEGIKQEGTTLEDCIFLNDLSEYNQGKYQIKLSSEVPIGLDENQENAETQVPDNNQNTPQDTGNSDNVSQNTAQSNTQNSSSSGITGSATNASAAQTSDAGIALAAFALAAAGMFVIFKKHN